MENSELRVLVCIASFGFKNQVYLESIIEEYRKTSFNVKVVVVSDQPKNLGDDVEVIVGLPTDNPHSLPFAHKNVFYERSDLYDLFIYSEDDIYISKNNIKAFLELNDILPYNAIPGFILYEISYHGKRYFPDFFSYYSWALNSVEKHGNELFARFENEHSASYMLTKLQLQQAIASGGFLVEPHEGDYDLECTAATDPYTQCGFRRLICVTRFEEIILHHMPNRYIGAKGICYEELNKQIAVLKESFSCQKEQFSLFPTRKNLPIRHWDKQFYEEIDTDILKALIGPNKRILSVGAGYGGLEQAIMRLGHHVTAIPIDNIMAASLQYRGIEITEPQFKSALDHLKDTSFHCIILSNILQHLSSPEELLLSLEELLDTDAMIIIKIHNYDFLRWRSFKNSDFLNSELNCLSYKKVTEWLKNLRFNVVIKPQGSDKVIGFFHLFGTILSSYLARSFLLIALR